ncbi:hypothetical protein AAHA92_00859 [Salvia divinorum]|uniref:Bidirectional sugar transporter SWEET n=1 Tax=Salvia divinorum TaxID=28513 RepID=A0ABD1IKZ2_SALDI
MQGIDLGRFIVGIIGNILSGLLFVSPVPIFSRICNNKSTEEFPPYPYLAGVMNCMLWIFYGLPYVHPDSTLLLTIYSFGLFLEITYLSVFFIYSSKNKYRWIIFICLFVELVVLGVIVAFTILSIHTYEKRSMFVGIVCNIFGIIMYASPLSNLFNVIKTKSAEFMPFWLIVAGFANGITWFTYAFLKTVDLYIAVGNGIGLLFCLIQPLVFACYTFKPNSSAAASEDAVSSNS